MHLAKAKTKPNLRGPFIAVIYSIETLEALVAATFAVPVGELRASGRGNARAAFARQSAMYLAHIAFGLSCTDVGLLFGRDRTTAAHACRVIEERRDDPFFDAVLSALEACCCTSPSGVREGGAAA
ncbi:MAG TPA: helix-turn-helix domain-containing protein [Pseudorhodoplanes sp.]|jgi:chromosomal replication initiation ATPase DnaA|nr:helix-turn-helix domain-containing protein [Pseudorhodoplanes sp.]